MTEQRKRPAPGALRRQPTGTSVGWDSLLPSPNPDGHCGRVSGQVCMSQSSGSKVRSRVDMVPAACSRRADCGAWFRTILACAVLLGAVSPARAAMVSAASCDASAVQQAIDAAADGDTVRVPAGTCTWDRDVSISKTIMLVGAGREEGGTKLLHDGHQHGFLRIDVGAKTGPLDISGFWFFGGISDYYEGLVNWTGPVGWKRFRFHHNRMEDTQGWAMRGFAGVYGLIDNNEFTGVTAGIVFGGRGETDWETAPDLGSSNWFFVEDNEFNFDDWFGSSAGAPANDIEDGGRVVFRHNSFTNAFLQTHDRARNGWPSANGWEIYNNSFTHTSREQKWKAVDLSAGTGVVWGNSFHADWIVPIGAMDYKTALPQSIPRCDGNDPDDQNTPGSNGWRCQYQLGTGPLHVGNPVYVWSNYELGQLVGMECTSGCRYPEDTGPFHLQEGRDFINSGVDPKPQYQPFTYPHPARQGDSLRPKPPTELKVQ